MPGHVHSKMAEDYDRSHQSRIGHHHKAAAERAYQEADNARNGVEDHANQGKILEHLGLAKGLRGLLQNEKK